MRLRAPGAEAVERWRTLRALMPETGRAPVAVVGMTDADASGALERGAADLEATLAAASAVDVDRYLTERYGPLDDSEFDDDGLDDRAALAEELGIDPEMLPEDVLAPSSEFVLHRRVPSGDPHASVELLLLPSAHASEAPAYLAFGGWNEVPMPAELTAALALWRARYGAEPFGFSGDQLELSVARPPTDDAGALALAAQLYAFCPDLVDQGTFSVPRLARTLRGATVWSFWWD